jgi:formamidopyrimidine-DNA glycosylase
MMPELPEVETVMRGLVPLIQGQVIARVTVGPKKLRGGLSRAVVSRLAGQRVISLERRAKYILIHCSGAMTLVVHLGMTGGFTVLAPGQNPGPHDHIIFTFCHGLRLAFHDPRRFGRVEGVATADWSGHPSLSPLGPEPLADDFTGAVLRQRLAGKRVAIKTALLDQRVVAGVGNIYASEALFYARIHPHTPAGTLDVPACRRLVAATKRVLTASIKAGGSTLRDYRHPDGALGFFQDRFAVYGRVGAACPGCTCRLATTGGIVRTVQGGAGHLFLLRTATTIGLTFIHSRPKTNQRQNSTRNFIHGQS